MWKFQKNESDLWDGWNDAHIRTFTKNRFKSLTREILQNSLDARRDDSSPVVVEFESFKLPAECIPGIDELRNRLQQCHDTAPDREGKDERKKYSIKAEEMTKTREETRTKKIKVRNLDVLLKNKKTMSLIVMMKNLSMFL